MIFKNPSAMHYSYKQNRIIIDAADQSITVDKNFSNIVFYYKDVILYIFAGTILRKILNYFAS
jgi:hypothetical protein